MQAIFNPKVPILAKKAPAAEYRQKMEMN